MSDAADIAIDVNGKAGPNIRGRDIFGGYLGSDGIFYPSGCKDIGIYDSDPDDTWKNPNGDTWTCLPESNNVKNNGHGCTARVVEEGFKINY